MSVLDLGPSPTPIDPFAAAPGGVYEDAWVSIRSRRVAGSGPTPNRTTTPHFEVSSSAGRIFVDHTYSLDQIDDDLSGVIADELFQQGWVRGSDLFERIFTGVVLTTASDPLVAWEAFYRNTLRRIAEHGGGVSAARSGAVHGSIADYAPVYARASRLMVGDSALELGACFGFFSLVLADAGHPVVANDLSEGTVALLAAMAPRLGLDVQTLAGDATALPVDDRCVDTVFALHLLEHLVADHGEQVLAEAVRLARRRVVVAVPYEQVPDAAFGHLRSLNAADLVALGHRSGYPFEQVDDHGGWLVLDVGGSRTP